MHNFGVEYRNTLVGASNIDTYLYANVTSINMHPDADFIRDVSVKTLAGTNFSFVQNITFWLPGA
jgi:hypothetical protein